MGEFTARTIRIADGRELLLQRAYRSDARALAAFDDRLERTSEHGLRESGEALWSVRKWRSHIAGIAQNPNALLLLARDGRRIVGEVTLRSLNLRRLNHAVYLGIGVELTERGRGVGSALLGAALEWAEAHAGIERVGLSTLSGNDTARRLFERHGFTEEGRRVRQVRMGPGRYEDEVLMVRSVKPLPG